MDASYFTHFKKETTTKICSIRIKSLYMRRANTATWWYNRNELLHTDKLGSSSLLTLSESADFFFFCAVTFWSVTIFKKMLHALIRCTRVTGPQSTERRESVENRCFLRHLIFYFFM